MLENKVLVHYTARNNIEDTKSYQECVLTSYVVGADGANSEVAKQEIKNSSLKKLVFAYHEIVQRPEKASENYEPDRCDVIYSSQYSPDFYSWVFPHGSTFSIGTGSAKKEFSFKGAISRLKEKHQLNNLKDIYYVNCP